MIIIVLRTIEELFEGETQLICLSVSEPATIKRLVIDSTHNLLLKKKMEFKVKQIGYTMGIPACYILNKRLICLGKGMEITTLLKY